MRKLAQDLKDGDVFIDPSTRKMVTIDFIELGTFSQFLHIRAGYLEISIAPSSEVEVVSTPEEKTSGRIRW